MLLTRAGIPFRVTESYADEECVTGLPPAELALERAHVKAGGARGQNGDIILGVDTVVALGSRDFGKPRDRKHAYDTLLALQATTHEVITGHWCVRIGRDNFPNGQCGDVARANVTMKAMKADEIEAYVNSGESDGRAGAYAIQETGDRFVSSIEGEWDTIVGLSVSTVLRLIRRLEIRPSS